MDAHASPRATRNGWGCGDAARRKRMRLHEESTERTEAFFPKTDYSGSVRSSASLCVSSSSTSLTAACTSRSHQTSSFDYSFFSSSVFSASDSAPSEATASAEAERREHVFLPPKACKALPLTLQWVVHPGAFVVAGQTLALLYPEASSPSSASYPPASSSSSSAGAREEVKCGGAGARRDAGSAEVAESGASAAGEGGDATAKDESQEKKAQAALQCFNLAAPVAGRVVKLAVEPGALIREDRLCLCEIEAASCTHPLVVGGLCAVCGVEIRDTHVQEQTVQAGFVSKHKDLRLDREVARRMEYERMAMLLAQRKLCLILDLDNTLLQASPDPPPADGPPLIVLDDFLHAPSHSARAPTSAASCTNASPRTAAACSAGEAIKGVNQEAAKVESGAERELSGLVEGVEAAAREDRDSCEGAAAQVSSSQLLNGQAEEGRGEAHALHTANAKSRQPGEASERSVSSQETCSDSHGARGDKAGNEGKAREAREDGEPAEAGIEGRRAESRGKARGNETYRAYSCLAPQPAFHPPWILRRGVWAPPPSVACSSWEATCFPARERRRMKRDEAPEEKKEASEPQGAKEAPKAAKDGEQEGDPTNACKRRCGKRGAAQAGEKEAYPHYREDEEGERIRRILESSVMCVRVAADASRVSSRARSSRRAEKCSRASTFSQQSALASSASPAASAASSVGSRDAPCQPPLPCEQHITFFKIRPGCLNFLRHAAKRFELYMYTMGTALHAAMALRILDPDRRFFGRRVFSREDAVNGLKEIESIFPHDKKMVLVVDDLECMWSYAPCCIKIQGYHYFADSSAADARRILPHNYTHWLSMARPYCNFLPSVQQQVRPEDRVRGSSKATLSDAGRPPSSPEDIASFSSAASSSSSVSSSTDSSAFPASSSPAASSSALSASSSSASSSSASPSSSCAASSSFFSSSASSSTPSPPGGSERGDSDRGVAYEASSGAGAAPPPSPSSLPAATASSALSPPSSSPSSDSSSAPSSNEPADGSPATPAAAFDRDGFRIPAVLRKLARLPRERSAGGAVPQPRPASSSASGDSSRRAEPAFSRGAASSSPHSPPFFKPSLIEDSDRQLLYLTHMLNVLHRLFYRAADRVVAAASPASPSAGSAERLQSAESGGGDFQEDDRKKDEDASWRQRAENAEEEGERRRKGAEFWNADRTGSLLSLLPDIAWVLESVRGQTLKGVTLSSSGVQGQQLARFTDTDLARLALTIGANVVDSFRSSVTHLLCTKVTDKYNRAGDLKIHRPHVMWLEKALYTWRRPDETPFEFRRCEGRYRSFWEVEDSQPPSEETYRPVEARVEAKLRAAQEPFLLQLSRDELRRRGEAEAAEAAEERNTVPVKLEDGATGGGADGAGANEEASDEQTWDDFWADAFDDIGGGGEENGDSI
ncbi:NLI interacting factor family phosphatase [Besnoitia besnoiti]|uniref:protein-serine/threonine phosphatase n=1 Tax=Besnoitia besnoiti TaxID=94643 RepID=A0A2A9MCM2_BESBE|nr:NLI interacting factor family phosphatase [Besnoitia besnoiti]PFH34974.1 NLI interacting factor family phosphatase [Besnoitia besnoiti]